MKPLPSLGKPCFSGGNPAPDTEIMYMYKPRNPCPRCGNPAQDAEPSSPRCGNHPCPRCGHPAPDAEMQPQMRNPVLERGMRILQNECGLSPIRFRNLTEPCHIHALPYPCFARGTPKKNNFEHFYFNYNRYLRTGTTLFPVSIDKQ